MPIHWYLETLRNGDHRRCSNLIEFHVVRFFVRNTDTDTCFWL